MALTSSVISYATKTVARFAVRVTAEEWIGQFSQIQLWRSRLSEGGPYEEVTGVDWAPARLVIPGPNAAPGLGPLVGKTLTLNVNEMHDIDFVFSGTNPLSLSAVAAQLTGLFTTASVVGSTVVIETKTPGASSSLRVVGGEAAPLLGLPVQVVFGADARYSLHSGQTVYQLIDPQGSSGFWYRIRFSSPQTALISEYSAPFQATKRLGVSADSLVEGTLDLVDGQGRAMANRGILVWFPNQYLVVENKNIMTHQEKYQTDEDGHLSLYLVRGVKFRLAIAGTDMVREITAPSDVSIATFNIFDPTYGTDDVMKVQQPNVDFAVRRTLP